MKLLVPVIAIMLSLISTAKANIGISMGLFQTVALEKNCAIAPNALESMLGLLYYGSAGSTEGVLKSNLFGGQSREEILIANKELVKEFTGYRSVGSIWLSERVEIAPSFVAAAKDGWGFPVGRTSLRESPSQAAMIINNWYRQQTNGYVSSVISPDELSAGPDMVAILLTAFRLGWKEDYFDPADTKREVFHASSEEKFQVEMMKGAKTIDYYEDETFQAVKLLYTGDDFELFVFLPKEPLTFDSDIRKLTGDYMVEVNDGMEKKLVNYWLPKVDYMTRIEWYDKLRRSSLKNPFTPGEADFTRINNNKPEPLYVGQLVQEVFVSWDETGTTARSTTKALMDPFGPTDAPITEPLPFRANHPFVYVIYNNKNVEIAFAGVVASRNQMKTLF